MPVIDTATLSPGGKCDSQQQVYNGLDACITIEVLDALLALGPPPPSYSFLRALQGPFLEMQLRGFRVDGDAMFDALERMEGCVGELRNWLNELGSALGMKELNPRSQLQLQEALLRHLALPERWVFDKGVRKLSMNRDALEWYDSYLYARPIVRAALSTRDTYADIKTLKTEVRSGRWHTSWNLSGTDTGRLSSSKAWDGSGSNLQNVVRDSSGGDSLNLRRMFIADEGRILVSMDRKQSEAREVGFLLGKLFDDWTYLDLLEQPGGDIHTWVARETWCDLPWTGDLREDRKVAERPYYRNNSYRDMAKKLAHGSSYLGTPRTMAHHANCSVKFVEAFQERFFTIFPAMRKWHRWTAERLQLDGCLENLFGDKRQFFDDPLAPETLRKAVAYIPQSSTARRTNMGVLALWRSDLPIELLAQGHDSVTFQCRQENLEEVIPKALHLTEIPLTASNGRTFIVPGDCKVGWNWGNASSNNIEGLKEWAGQENRIRSTPQPFAEMCL